MISWEAGTIDLSVDHIYNLFQLISSIIENQNPPIFFFSWYDSSLLMIRLKCRYPNYNFIYSFWSVCDNKSNRRLFRRLLNSSIRALGVAFLNSGSSGPFVHANLHRTSTWSKTSFQENCPKIEIFFVPIISPVILERVT